MITIKPQEGQMMAWQDVKQWVDSMDETQLAQAACVMTVSGVVKLVGTTTVPANTGYPLPRLIGGVVTNGHN